MKQEEIIANNKCGSTCAGGVEIETVNLSLENRPNGFTTDKAFRQGDVMVQRVGGSTSWSVAIDGVAKGRVLDAYTKEQALIKAWYNENLEA